MAKQLAKLMAPSLFVHDLPEQVTRCTYLMDNYPLALLALLSDLMYRLPFMRASFRSSVVLPRAICPPGLEAYLTCDARSFFAIYETC